MSAELLDWSSAGRLETIVEYEVEGAARKLSIRPAGGWRYDVGAGGSPHVVAIKAMNGETVRLVVDDHMVEAMYRDDGRTIWLATATRSLELANLASFIRPKKDSAGQGLLFAPMHGRLVDICVAEGAQVSKGDRLAVLEAMKMQHELTAGIDGRVKHVAATAGVQIAARDLILEIEPAPSRAGVSS
jgi:geranyl-CoA carboxylase alpha subunit